MLFVSRSWMYKRKRYADTISRKVDKEIFRSIFIDHWESFKARNPGYDILQYEEPVQKMLGWGYPNLYKIKLKSFGYRSAYLIEDQETCVYVICIGRRDKIYKILHQRLDE
jgi:mRNA-degrading endonuclease RelE of RelBE toxin-antitoxin system